LTWSRVNNNQVFTAVDDLGQEQRTNNRWWKTFAFAAPLSSSKNRKHHAKGKLMRIRHQIRRGRFSGEGPKMLVVRKYIFYTPTQEARAVMAQWPNGIGLEWEVDDVTLQPLTAHLIPSAVKGLKIQGDGFVSLPTRAVGDAISAHGSVEITEVRITDTEIVITVPFRFVIADRRVADRRVTAVAAE
jgi:hypothetical protein